jgi:hypothetical protein
MSFDTDYLNSQKEKLNESISNFIRFDLPSVYLKDKRCCCFQTFKDLILDGHLKNFQITTSVADDKITNLQAQAPHLQRFKELLSRPVLFGSAKVQAASLPTKIFQSFFSKFWSL